MRTLTVTLLMAAWMLLAPWQRMRTVAWVRTVWRRVARGGSDE